MFFVVSLLRVIIFMKNNIVKEKSYRFAVSVFPLYQILKSKREYDMANQLWRSSTSICANIEESVAASSKSDFIYKLTIALKEARESRDWLNLLRDVHLLEDVEDNLEEIEHIINILTSAIKTLHTVKPNKI